MPGWGVALIVVGSIFAMVVLYDAIKRIGQVARGISGAGGDTAPGWILRCTRCQAWRPATEAGVIREFARGKKYTPARCSSCGELCPSCVEKGPGPQGKRQIDERTNAELWPETIPQPSSSAVKVLPVVSLDTRPDASAI